MNIYFPFLSIFASGHPEIIRIKLNDQCIHECKSIISNFTTFNMIIAPLQGSNREISHKWIYERTNWPEIESIRGTL